MSSEVLGCDLQMEVINASLRRQQQISEFKFSMTVNGLPFHEEEWYKYRLRRFRQIRFNLLRSNRSTDFSLDVHIENTTMEFDEPTVDNSSQNENQSTNVATGEPTAHLQRDPSSSVWNYMSKEPNQKAKCNICSTVLSRTNGSTTGLRKHLYQVHKLAPFGVTKPKATTESSQISPDRKQTLHSLVIACVIRDGRSFDDPRRPGLMQVFNLLAPGLSLPR